MRGTSLITTASAATMFKTDYTKKDARKHNDGRPRPNRLPSAESLVAPPREWTRAEGRLESGSEALPTERRAGVADGAKPKADAPATSATKKT